MERATARLRVLLRDKDFVYMPAVYHPLGGRLVEDLGFDAAYVGGYVTGGSLAVSEPLLTMDEQLSVAAGVANAISLPVVVDGGAGFGEPLHTMRTVREAIRGGIAGMHIEDQLYPKRAHYHKYVAHAVPTDEFVDKIRYACRARDETDPDFVVIARTDTCRFHGLDEAADRLNRAADAGADMGLLFPRDEAEAREAPKRIRLPLVYVQSRGNRDGRPLYSNQQLQEMGWRACIDAQIFMLAALDAAERALTEVRDTGAWTGLSDERAMEMRKRIETLIGLDRFYEIEEETVEKRKWGDR